MGEEEARDEGTPTMAGEENAERNVAFALDFFNNDETEPVGLFAGADITDVSTVHNDVKNSRKMSVNSNDSHLHWRGCFVPFLLDVISILN